MSAHPIPSGALVHHIAILGKTGSGKSNAAKTLVEAALKAGERVCILDPTGAWFGLRLTRAGAPSPYPVVIFGGQHADIEIADAHGAAIAEIVGTSSTSAIIDTRLMTVGQRTRLFTDFAEALLRKNRGPLTLIIDEAHLFAPQGRVADPQSGRMLHAANNLVSLGRSIGLRVIMLSQRPVAVLGLGLEAACAAPRSGSMADVWSEALPQPANKMFAMLLTGPVSTDELAASLAMQPRGGHWNNGIATLRRNGLIEERAGRIHLTEIAR